jgi:hypothetical protein
MIGEDAPPARRFSWDYDPSTGKIVEVFADHGGIVDRRAIKSWRLDTRMYDGRTFREWYDDTLDLRLSSYADAQKPALPDPGLPNDVLQELLRLLAPLKIEGDAYGLVFEYFMGQFAFSFMQKGGEYFTPASIVKLIVEVIEPYHGMILDPAYGSGGMFVHSAQFVRRHHKAPSRENQRLRRREDGRHSALVPYEPRGAWALGRSAGGQQLLR